MQEAVLPSFIRSSIRAEEGGGGAPSAREAVDGLSTTVGGEPVARWGATPNHHFKHSLESGFWSLGTYQIPEFSPRTGLQLTRIGLDASIKHGKKQLDLSKSDYSMKFPKFMKPQSLG